MLSDEEINEIAKRCEAATPGPWGTYRSLNGWHYTTPDHPDGVRRSSEQSAANAIFIAGARQDIPRLLDALREARKAHEKCGTEWAEGVMGMTKQRNEAHRALEELLDYVDHSPRCRYVINQQLPFGGFEGCECGLKEAVSRAVKLVGAPEPEDA